MLISESRATLALLILRLKIDLLTQYFILFFEGSEFSKRRPKIT